MKNKTMESRILSADQCKTYRLLDGTNAADLAASIAEIHYGSYLDEVLRICRQYDHPGCNAGSHELSRQILNELRIFDEVRAEEVDELSFRGSAENE